MFESFTSSMQALFERIKGKSTITEGDLDALLDKIRDSFLAADVPYRITKEILAGLRHELMGKTVTKRVKPDEQIVHAVYQKLKDLLGEENAPLSIQKQEKILVMGLQGAGKTTTLGKLASYIRQRGTQARILMASLDFQRPAAREQLAQLAQRIAIDIYWTKSTDPIQAAQELERYYVSNKYDIVLIDTAGRLHTSEELLSELKSVVQQIRPTKNILVLDGMIGQESLNVATAFQKAIDLTGAIITKIDSGARAGCVLAFRSLVSKPILFVGTGEAVTELEPFIPERVARRLLGDGDLATLWERAQVHISAQEQERLERSMKRGVLTLEDFGQQLKILNRLGSLGSLLKYMPGMGGISMTGDQLKHGENEMRVFRAIIDSMTHKERIMPAIIDGSRRQRIARGAGVQAADIKRLLTTFEQTQKLVKMVGKMRMPW